MMLPIVIFVVFIAALVIGSLVANALGVLPTADEIVDQDARRMGKFEKSL
jgi:hypothetical protein